jgi:hypothetical protein
MTARALVILTAICLTTGASAQDAPPKIGNKPLVQVKPKEPIGCKLVGTVIPDESTTSNGSSVINASHTFARAVSPTI